MKALWAFPEQAWLGRPVPKTRFYEKALVTARRKALFVRQVEQIVWQYKLAPETINLPATPAVPEIQVFAISLRTPELDRDVLRCIDGAVLFPILFELQFEGRTQMVACYKRPDEARAGRWVTGDYFAGPWLRNNSKRAALPLSLSLGVLYEHLLQPLIPVPHRQGETLAERIERAGRARAKQREVEQAQMRMQREKQFNRKVELNAELRQLNKELEALRR